MPKSNAKLSKKYKESFEVLKKNYEVVCQKNAKFVEVNNLFGLVERKWKKENDYLRLENSLEVSKTMKLRKDLEKKEKEITELKNEIKHLMERLQKKEMEEIKEEIPNDF